MVELAAGDKVHNLKFANASIILKKLFSLQ